MKTLNKILSLALIMLMTTAFGQMSKNGTMSANKMTTTNITVEGNRFPVDIMTYESRKYEMKWDEEDKGKVDQDRTSSLAKVTKLIHLKSENEKLNNQYVVIQYDRQVTDTFKVTPIGNGFAVTVDDKEVRYVFNEGRYEVDTDDDDFFIIEEFSSK